ncbi:hypothetical protein EKG40_05985 [Pseudomonas moorei]|nr:hypothetical protein EKG40_05985 [Pseudomonas moorei]
MGRQKITDFGNDADAVRARNHQPKSAHEGKLQNFAKAGILTIAQQNCSIDDVAPCPNASDRTFAAVGNRR